MMERRYQVFVSSTFEDLKAEREGVLRALLTIDCFPASMEAFGAASNTPWDIITSTIDLCDYYLLISAGKYGSLDDQGKGFTEKEFEYASEKGIPCLAFLRADIDSLPVNRTETDPDRKNKLNKFQDRVKDSHLFVSWENIDDLKFKVIASLSKEMRRNPRSGWVRAGQVAETDTLQKLEAARSQIDDLNQRIASSAKTDPDAVIDEILSSDVRIQVRKQDFDDDVGDYVVRTFSEFSVDVPSADVFNALAGTLYGGASNIGLRKVVKNFVSKNVFEENSSKIDDLPTSYQRQFLDVQIKQMLLLFDRFELLRSERVSSGDSAATQWMLNDFGRRVYSHLERRKQAGT